MIQHQAILTVRIVLDDDETLADAEALVADVLTEAELMAHIKGNRIELVEVPGKIVGFES